MLGQDLALVPQEELEQGHLPRRQLELGGAPERPPGNGVQAKVARLEHHRPLLGSPPQEGAQPGHQHDVGEGFRQVVVGSRVQRLRLVQLPVLGGQHENRRPVALLTQGGADLVAVHARQHDVEDDGVVGILPGHPETVGAGQCDVGREALRLQALLEPGRKPLLVIHDQDPHHPTSSPMSPCCAAAAERDLNAHLVVPERPGSRTKHGSACAQFRTERLGTTLPPGSPDPTGRRDRGGTPC